MAKIKSNKLESKKEVILTNAALLFRKKGFKAASLRALAETMNIEAPSLYNHIESKAAILQDICFEVAAIFTNHMAEVMGSKTKAEDKIIDLIQFHINQTYINFDAVFVSNHEWKHLPKKSLDIFLKQRKAYEKNFIAIIEDGIQKKQLKKINPQIAVLTILSAIRGLEFLHSHIKEHSQATVTAALCTQLLTGIKN
jgi:TetR/AcrR family transcriptional regulator, cholesterol catabolism regulator